MKINSLTLSKFFALVFVFCLTGCPVAEFDANYTIKYDANGGTGKVPKAHKVKEGQTITIAEPDGLSHSGKIFTGWNTLKYGNGSSYAPGDSMKVEYGYTLYAQWANVQYTVTYNANGGTGTAPVAQIAGEGANVTVANQGTLTYQGKIFNGWNTEPDGSGTPYAAGASITMSEDIVLYAQWLPGYTISYNANGATGLLPTAQTAIVGSKITVANWTLWAYAGKKFNGWNTESDGSGTPYAAGAYLTVNADIVLYAQWLPIQYTITYNANGGTGAPEPQIVDYGETVTISSGTTLQRTGYFFNGWNTNTSGTGTNYVAGSSYKPTGNMILYAQWIASPQIREGDAYKEVTSDGTVKITLMTGSQYIYNKTDSYRLYRSETETGGYSVVATITATASPVLQDTTIDWTKTTGSYFYKVAAIVNGNELMSRNGVKIDMVNPRAAMRYSAYNNGYGYCGVRLEFGVNGYVEWEGTTTESTSVYILSLSDTEEVPPPPGNYTLKTKTLDWQNWTDRGSLTIRASHTYIINVLLGSVNSGFDESNWTSFTP